MFFVNVIFRFIIVSITVGTWFVTSGGYLHIFLNLPELLFITSLYFLIYVFSPLRIFKKIGSDIEISQFKEVGKYGFIFSIFISICLGPILILESYLFDAESLGTALISFMMRLYYAVFIYFCCFYNAGSTFFKEFELRKIAKR